MQTQDGRYDRAEAVLKRPASGETMAVRRRHWPDGLAWPLGAILPLAGACYGLILPGRPIHRVGDFASHTLYTSFIVLTAALLLWRGLRVRAERYRLWWPPAVGAGSFACVEGLKGLTHLARPDGAPTGFPSGHTTFSFALAWLLSRAYPRLTPLWYGIAVLIGWSRVEGDAHFPYQVLCGAVFGTLVGLAISRSLPGASPPKGA